jgi:hypothetical protein
MELLAGSSFAAWINPHLTIRGIVSSPVVRRFDSTLCFEITIA